MRPSSTSACQRPPCRRACDGARVPPHAPYTHPYGDVVDGYVLRCDCGCGLFESYPTRTEAAQARDAAEIDRETR